MKFNHEAEVLKALGIDNWGGLASGVVPELLQLIPAMDRDLALSILPKLTADVVGGAFSTLQAALLEHGKSQDRLHEIDVKTHDLFLCAMQRADSAEERAQVRNDYREARHEAYAKNTENKNFVKGLVVATLGFSSFIILKALMAARGDSGVVAA